VGRGGGGRDTMRECAEEGVIHWSKTFVENSLNSTQKTSSSLRSTEKLCRPYLALKKFSLFLS
jgi:hypothetical protein